MEGFEPEKQGCLGVLKMTPLLRGQDSSGCFLMLIWQEWHKNPSLGTGHFLMVDSCSEFWNWTVISDKPCFIWITKCKDARSSIHEKKTASPYNYESGTTFLGQIKILPKPELRGFLGDSLTFHHHLDVAGLPTSIAAPRVRMLSPYWQESYKPATKKKHGVSWKLCSILT